MIMMRRQEKNRIILPIVEAIMDDRRPKTQEKGKEIAKAREPNCVTCFQKKHKKK